METQFQASLPAPLYTIVIMHSANWDGSTMHVPTVSTWLCYTNIALFKSISVILFLKGVELASLFLLICFLPVCFFCIRLHRSFTK